MTDITKKTKHLTFPINHTNWIFFLSFMSLAEREQPSRMSNWCPWKTSSKRQDICPSAKDST